MAIGSTQCVRAAMAFACVALGPWLEPPVVHAQQADYTARCSGAVTEWRAGTVVLPDEALFCQLVADPKAAHTFATWLHGDFAGLAHPNSESRIAIAAVGLGDRFGLLRLAGDRPGDGVQLDIVGAVFAQFNLSAPSFDLINADYLIGLPIAWRRGRTAAQLRLYHQSSHVGDELLFVRDPDRNPAWESIDLTVAQDLGYARVYAGVEHRFRRQPSHLAPNLLRGGVEVRYPAGTGRFLGALDFRLIDRVDRRLAWSARTGVEVARFGGAGGTRRVISVLGQLYHGFAPYGQFHLDDISFYGLGIHFSL